MGWPIPEIPERSILPAPHFGRWVISLLFMLMAGSLIALFLGHFSTYFPVLLYGALPAFLLWLCLFGLVLNRYDQSSASVHSWNEESQKTKSQWQQWSRKQLAVVGNVLMTPEVQGMGSMLGALANIPMFPQKARPIWGEKKVLSSRLNLIDSQLEEQAVGYRHHLYTIYILCSSTLHRETIESSVYNQWQLVPQFVSSIHEIEALNFETEINGISLILCFRHWPENRPQKTSEFISAQLISSPEFVATYSYSILAGLGRMMPLSPDKLPDDLSMLFDYNKLTVNDVEHVWLSGETEDTAVHVTQFAEARHWVLPKKQPVHYIDLTFGPSGQFALPLSLSMMVEATGITKNNQLIIYQESHSSGWMCLVTKELFS